MVRNIFKISTFVPSYALICFIFLICTLYTFYIVHTLFLQFFKLCIHLHASYRLYALCLLYTQYTPYTQNPFNNSYTYTVIQYILPYFNILLFPLIFFFSRSPWTKFTFVLVLLFIKFSNHTQYVTTSCKCLYLFTSVWSKMGTFQMII